MLTNKDYCDYETRLGLRDVGYPMSTCQINDGPIQMPKITLYEAQKWLREEKNIFITLSPNINDKHCFYWEIYTRFKESWEQIAWCKECYDLPEEALLEGIKEAVKILKEE